jgi:hypothetical protein
MMFFVCYPLHFALGMHRSHGRPWKFREPRSPNEKANKITRSLLKRFLITAKNLQPGARENAAKDKLPFNMPWQNIDLISNEFSGKKLIFSRLKREAPVWGVLSERLRRGGVSKSQGIWGAFFAFLCSRPLSLHIALLEKTVSSILSQNNTLAAGIFPRHTANILICTPPAPRRRSSPQQNSARETHKRVLEKCASSLSSHFSHSIF